MRGNLVSLIVALVVSRLQCLSLDQIHSSSKTFKSLSHNRDKSPKTGLESIRNRRQEYRYDWKSSPLTDLEYYKRLMASNNYQPVDNFLMYNPSESENFDDLKENDLLSTELGLRLAEILGSDSDVGHRVYNRINKKRKRSASNRNYYTQTNEIKDKSAKTKRVGLKSAVSSHSGHGGRSGQLNLQVKHLRQHKTPIKSVVKRKSGRRVLEDHFHVEESNQNVINKNNYIKPITFSAIHSKSKSKLNKNIENKLRKSIKKRREANALMALEDSLRSDRNKTSKQQQNELKTNDKTVVTELKNILSDDNTNDSKMKKNTIETVGSKKSKRDKEVMEPIQDLQTGILTKRKTKRSDSSVDTLPSSDVDSDSAIIYQKAVNTDDNEESDEDKLRNKQNMNEWLRKEFYENIAKTLATMRKKRSNDNTEFDGFDDMEGDRDNLIAIDESNEDDDNFNSNQLLQRIPDDSNDYVIAAIEDEKDSVLPNNLDDSNDDTQDLEEENDGFDWQELEEKSKSKTKRSADSYFGDLEANEETNEINIDSDRFKHINTKLESIEDTLINEAMNLIRETAAKGSEREAQNSKRIANRLDAAYDIENMRTALEDLGNAFHKIGDEYKDNDNELVQQTSSEESRHRNPISAYDHNIDKKSNILEDIQDVQDIEDSEGEPDSESECSALELLSSDCSSVADLVPTARVRYAFVESCNWHQICYTCGEIYGLMASDCDAGFLEASRLSCGDSPSCEAFARLVLAPLRQSRVFYKTSIPQTCYQYRCIKDFLFDTKR